MDGPTSRGTPLPFSLGGLDHVVLAARDMDKAIGFWRALGAREERRLNEISLVQLRAGDALIDLVPSSSPGEGRNVDHICLTVEPWDEAAIRDYLQAQGIAAPAAERRYGAQGYGPSIYIEDLDGNTIELKGPPEGSGLLAEAVAREIEALHGFFVAWFSGSLPNTQDILDRQLSARLAADFTYLPPGGTLLERSDLIASLRPAHGSNPAFRIKIGEIEVIAAHGDLAVVRYLEQQTNARNTEPADNARRTTAVLRRADDAPFGWRWQHVQETFVGTDERAAMDFGF
jgi:hypothetical protein